MSKESDQKPKIPPGVVVVPIQRVQGTGHGPRIDPNQHHIESPFDKFRIGGVRHVIQDDDGNVIEPTPIPLVDATKKKE